MPNADPLRNEAALANFISRREVAVDEQAQLIEGPRCTRGDRHSYAAGRAHHRSGREPQARRRRMTPCQNLEPITSLHSSVGLRRLLLPTEVLIEVNLLPEPFDEFAPLLLRGSAPHWF